MLTQQLKRPFKLLSGSLITLLAATSITIAQGWERVPIPLPEDVTGMSFVNADTGYISTGFAKYGRTLDGGKSWKFYTIQNDSTFEDIYFLNRDTGIVCGAGGRVHRTVDGCKNWDIGSIGQANEATWLLSAVMLPGGVALMNGIVPGQPPMGALFRSEDAGKTWTKLDVKGIAFGELYYRPGDPICFQSYGKLFYSLDKGKTWSSMNVPNGKPTRATTFFKNTGILCGNSGAVVYTSDRGKTWSTVKTNDSVNFTSALLLDEKTGYIAGTGGSLLKTTDGGQSWTPEKLPSDADLMGMCRVGDILYVYGENGLILRHRLK